MDKLFKIYNVTPMNCDNRDMLEFEENVKKAKELGATHIVITDVLKSRFFWENDLRDPYPNWEMLNSSLFKIILPEELKEYLPNDYVSKNYDLVKERANIIKKHGLKGAAYFCEPHFLPEEVFKKHPSWRGPRCEHPRRARNYYYCPCMDNPEVLAMYKKAIKKLCELCDIEYMYLHTDDCAAGICWSNGLYAGPNGPEACKHIPASTRVLNYLSAFQDAVNEAGYDLYIETNNKIGVKELDSSMESLYPVLKDKMAVNFKTNDGSLLSSLIDLNYEFTVAPIKKIPMAIELIRQLNEAYQTNSKILRVNIVDQDFNLQYEIIKEFNKNRTNGIVDCYNILNAVSKRIVKNKPNMLVDIWQHIDDGLHHFYSTLIEGLTWVSVNQRLINRPFVLFQNELTDDEKDYYQRFQFQAGSVESSYDLLNNQGSGFVKGYYAVFIASKLLDRSIASLNKAIKLYQDLYDIEKNEDLLIAKDRIKVLVCFIKNYQNAMNFQEIIDETDYTVVPSITLRWPQEADQRLLAYERITRAEIDNMYDLISLIEGRENDMLVLAPSIEEEDIFWLTTNITKQLYKKIDIMLSHFLDGNRLYITNNK